MGVGRNERQVKHPSPSPTPKERRQRGAPCLIGLPRVTCLRRCLILEPVSDRRGAPGAPPSGQFHFHPSTQTILTRNDLDGPCGADHPGPTYGGVAVGRIPGLRLDRAGIAFLGGAAMIAVGALSIDDAFRAIDWDTIALLVGMMIVVAHLKVSGAFRGSARWRSSMLMRRSCCWLVTLLAGALSAFLVNDAICLVMAPIVVHATRAMKRDPLPYLVATATASNCGSVATITGNPQNMVIGALSGISYPAFSAALAPVAVFGLVAVIVVVRLVYREEFARRAALNPHVLRGAPHPWPDAEGELVCVALAIAFFAGMRPPKPRCSAAPFCCSRASLKPQRIYREIDGPLLMLFAGLFVVVAGAERALLTPDIVASTNASGSMSSGGFRR